MRNAVRGLAFAAGLFAAVSFTAAGCSGKTSSGHATYNLGRPATLEEISRLDIDVAPDGAGLPPGRGEPVDGAPLFTAMCLRCHGSFLKLAPERWAYATSIFDYVRRAMPPDPKRPLTSDEIYGLTAYLLYINGEIGPHAIMERSTLTHVAMPRVKDFISTP